MRLKLDTDMLGLCTLAERISRARIKDCFQDQDQLYFIVDASQMGKIIGKGGVTIKKLSTHFKKKVKVVIYSDDVCQFVRNFVVPLTVEEVRQEDGTIIIKDSNKKTKSLLIGRQGRNLQTLQRAVSRFFPVEVKVL